MVPSQPALTYVAADPWVRWYTGPGCTVAEAGTDFPIGSVAESDVWTRLIGPLTVPDTAKSVRLFLAVVKDSDSSPGIAYFDDVYLPEPGSPTLSIAALAALAAVSSRRSDDRRHHRLDQRGAGLR
jgi:hypothetical protein